MSLVACSLLLVPEQGTRLLGIEWIALALAFGIFLLWTYLRVDIANAGGRTVVVGRIVTHILVAVLFLAAGVATAASLGGGIYWIVPASLWAIAVGLADAWVLLVEILR